MMQLKDLKARAHELGLTLDQVRAFGDLRRKATWEAAIASVPTAAIERNKQLDLLVASGFPEPGAIAAVRRSPVPAIPCPRCHGALWEILAFDRLGARIGLCPACTGNGSAIPQAARDPPVGPA